MNAFHLPCRAGRTMHRLGLLLVLFCVAAVGRAGAQGTLDEPLVLGVTAPVMSESGQTLQGRDQNPRELVMILWASNNWIYVPADLEGNPDPRNPLVEDGLARIGELTVAQGTFSWYYPTNSGTAPNSGRVFIRVFNGPTLAESSFYGDSEMLDLSRGRTLNGTIDSTRYPLDSGDSDGDGLINSLEDSLGTDRWMKDTDGDSFTDWEEYRAGTDGTDDTSFLVMAWVRPGPGTDAIVAWKSVPGKKYRVQYTENDLMDEELHFADIEDVITATEDYTEVVVTEGLSALSGRGHFRVLLVEE